MTFDEFRALADAALEDHLDYDKDQSLSKWMKDLRNAIEEFVEEDS